MTMRTVLPVIYSFYGVLIINIDSPVPRFSSPPTESINMKELPAFEAESFRTDPYIEAASKIQKMDKEKAFDQLRTLANIREHDVKTIVLCRMLFKCKSSNDFRRPALGAPYFFDSSEESDWPLEPIEVIDGVPFSVVKGYLIGGKPESAESYLNYCILNCDWNNERFTPKNIEEKKKALDKLLISKKWKKILTDDEKVILSCQIK